MIKINIDVKGLDEIKRRLAGMERKIEIATQRALLKTANHIRDAEQDEMRRVFDRPTRWTLGAMKVKPTAKFEVTVGILDPDGFYKRANNYLGTQISGGSRRMKAMEIALQHYGLMPSGWYAVPGAGAKMDAYPPIARILTTPLHLPYGAHCTLEVNGTWKQGRFAMGAQMRPLDKFEFTVPSLENSQGIPKR